jgi:hypothetical protein
MEHVATPRIGIPLMPTGHFILLPKLLITLNTAMVYIPSKMDSV